MKSNLQQTKGKSQKNMTENVLKLIIWSMFPKSEMMKSDNDLIFFSRLVVVVADISKLRSWLDFVGIMIEQIETN